MACVVNLAFCQRVSPLYPAYPLGLSLASFFQLLVEVARPLAVCFATEAAFGSSTAAPERFAVRMLPFAKNALWVLIVAKQLR